MTRDLDHDAISQTVRSLISFPILGLAVDDTTLYLRVPATRKATGLEELIQIAVVAECFDLGAIVFRRADVIFRLSTKDVFALVNGERSLNDFVDALQGHADANHPL